MKRNTLFLISLSFVIIFSSCTQKIYKEYNLFQKGLDSLKDYTYKAPLIQCSDRLSIKVFSATLSQEQALVFNLGGSAAGSANAGESGGSGSSGTTGSNSSGGASYLVDLNGYIKLPIIGNIKCVGLSLQQLDTILSKKLDTIIKDPVVTVSFAGFKVNILGEVMFQGTKQFTIPNPTIIDLISVSGGFTERAKRNEVYLVREINGKRNTVKINFNEVGVFNSDVYQLAQNDMVYVPSDTIKLKQVNRNPDFEKTTQNLQVVTTCVSVFVLLINSYFLIKNIAK